MTVRTKNQLTRTNIVFDHNLMADTLAFPEINTVFLCKISHLFLRCRRFRAIRRHIVVNNKNKLLCICNVRILQFVVIHIYCQMRCSVITHQSIQLNSMDVTWFNAVYASRCCDDFFCNCHSHGYFSSLFSEAIRPP